MEDHEPSNNNTGMMTNTSTDNIQSCVKQRTEAKQAAANISG